MWNFVSPRIVFGESSLSSLEDINMSRALVVTDKNLVQIGLVEPVLDLIKKSGCEVLVFDDVEPDPTLTSVELGKAAANDFQPDWIVGLGGGSPMDTAKAIWVLYERPDLIPAMINPFIELGLRKKSRLDHHPHHQRDRRRSDLGNCFNRFREQPENGIGEP